MTTGYPDFTRAIALYMQLIPLKGLPDWGAVEAEDVDVYGAADVASGPWGFIVVYTEPADKTLLIYDWSVILEDAENPVAAYLNNATTATIISVGGGGRGFQTPFSKPKRIPGGHTVEIRAQQLSGVTRPIHGHFGGVLI